MEESYSEDLANRDGPSHAMRSISCAAVDQLRGGVIVFQVGRQHRPIERHRRAGGLVALRRDED